MSRSAEVVEEAKAGFSGRMVVSSIDAGGDKCISSNHQLSASCCVCKAGARLQMQVVKSREKVLGSKHPRTLKAGQVYAKLHDCV